MTYNTTKVIFTFHPEIQLLLQKQYREAAESILPFKEWLSAGIPRSVRFQLFSEPEKQNYLKKFFPEIQEWVDVVSMLFKSLKDKQISADRFWEGIETSKLIRSKKDFLIRMARWYHAYLEKDRFFLDEEDLYQLSIENVSSFELDKAVVLALKLTSLEKQLFSELEKRGAAIDMIRSDPIMDGRTSLSVIEADSMYDEIESALKDISDHFRQGERECLIYCFREWPLYRQILSAACRDHGIPFDSLIVLPWDENTIVLGKRNLVYLMGMSDWNEESPNLNGFLLPDEMEHLNERLKSDIFELPDERKERQKQLLRYLMSCSGQTRVSYVEKRHSLLSEFLTEMGVLAKAMRTVAQAERAWSEARSHSWRSAEGARPSASANSPLGNLIACPNGFRQESPSLEKIFKEIPLPSFFSVSSLRQYQRCPYGFLIKECLGLHPRSFDPFDKISLTPAEEGEVYHDILRRYFSEKSGDLEKASEESFEALSVKFKKTIPPPVRLKIRKALSVFLTEEREWQKRSRFTPRYFERSFEIELKDPRFRGDDKCRGDDTGNVIQLRGKIDRIDVDEERKEFKIIDYKTGGSLPSAKEVMSGKDFQAVLYAIAVEEQILPGYRAAEGFCYHLKTAKAKKLFYLESSPGLTGGSNWEGLKKRTLDEVFSIVSAVQERRFNGTPQNCYHRCELRRVCGKMV